MAALRVLIFVGAALALPSSELLADDECAEDGSCALQALQVRSSRSSSQSGCHDVTEKDGPNECMKAIQWARSDGVFAHPDWYPGMTANSSLPEWQLAIHNTKKPACPRPCSIPEKRPWCADKPAPMLWAPAVEGEAIDVKILSYNLFWWHLFGVEGGRGNSAGNLIKNSDSPKYDVMGFQECEDKERVLGPVGLLDEYTAFDGTHAICMAYRKDTWALLKHGQSDVAEDMKTEYYGTRGTQWMQLEHKKTGRKLFFMNHHGPLSVNSGGLCGGKATAHHLMDVMAKNADIGDTLVLVGDFNANAASTTLQNLWPHLTHVYNSGSFGGVDNIFSNVDRESVMQTTDLGSGGSDHHAISAVIHVGPNNSSENISANSTGNDSSASTDRSIDTANITVADLSKQENCGKAYQQCGGTVNGKPFAGAKCCQANLTCQSNDQYYSQCVEVKAPQPGSSSISGGEQPEPAFAVHTLERARGYEGCLLEPQVQYVIEDGWKDYQPNVADPRACCERCEGQGACKAWVWTDWDENTHGPACTLQGGRVVSKLAKDGFVSGLPKIQAVSEANATAVLAKIPTAKKAAAAYTAEEAAAARAVEKAARAKVAEAEEAARSAQKTAAEKAEEEKAATKAAADAADQQQSASADAHNATVEQAAAEEAADALQKVADKAFKDAEAAKEAANVSIAEAKQTDSMTNASANDSQDARGAARNASNAAEEAAAVIAEAAVKAERQAAVAKEAAQAAAAEASEKKHIADEAAAKALRAAKAAEVAAAASEAAEKAAAAAAADVRAAMEAETDAAAKAVEKAAAAKAAAEAAAAEQEVAEAAPNLSWEPSL
eukprot:TRINITY_DN8712_c0_g1_i1.p1 TRINITY_DN8712_c0_g1~~TRINITY_DN8712_c0_g1_i1.p1  ORF type:complete len:834 (-),score=238.38 TRINITY_DN8712_c0_g1_i1:88-2589(-)